MATTAAKTPTTRTNVMEQFTWEGTDKRGVKMKGETTSKNAHLLRAALRKQGINPTVVRAKTKPLFGASANRPGADRPGGSRHPGRLQSRLCGVAGCG